MPFFPHIDIDHKCTIFDYCIVSEDPDVNILFCSLCRKVAGIQEGDIVKLKTEIITEAQKKEITPENREKWV